MRVRPNIVRKLVAHTSFNVTQQCWRHWEPLSEFSTANSTGFGWRFPGCVSEPPDFLTWVPSVAVAKGVWFGGGSSSYLEALWISPPTGCSWTLPDLTDWGWEPDWAPVRRAGTTESQRDIGGVIQGEEEGAQEAALELHELMMLSRWVHVEEDCEDFHSEETYFKVSR